MDQLQDTARLLNLFYPGSFPHLPIEEEPLPAPDPKPPGSLLQVADVAMMIGITDDTVRRWARAGKIASVRLSKVDVRFRRGDIEEFIGSRLHQRKSAFR